MARPEKIGQPLESIEALLHYLEEGSEKPASYGGVRQSLADQKRRGNYKGHKMTIHNGRAIAAQLSLEREGFILVNHETQMKNFYDEDEVRSVYYKETEELVASARIYPDRVGETCHMTFNPDHVWYYFPNMQRNETIVFKTFESERDGRARWTAHCAFDDPTSPPDAPPRESIEMRTLAFF